MGTKKDKSVAGLWIKIFGIVNIYRVTMGKVPCLVKELLEYSGYINLPRH